MKKKSKKPDDLKWRMIKCGGLMLAQDILDTDVLHGVPIKTAEDKEQLLHVALWCMQTYKKHGCFYPK